MIARTRDLTLKQYEVMQKEVHVRLTADTKAGQVGDCYVAIQMPTSVDALRQLADLHGKRYRVTIEEID